MDYRLYHLTNQSNIPTVDDLSNMYQVKKRIDSLYTTLGTFDRTQPIEFLNLIRTFKEAVEGFG